MKRLIALLMPMLIIGVLCGSMTSAAAEYVPATAKERAQLFADLASWSLWKSDMLSPWASMRNYHGPYHISVSKKLWIRITDAHGQLRRQWQGQNWTSFLIEGGTLYCARYSICECGGTIVAIDLPTGKERWTTRLLDVRCMAHSVYVNQIVVAHCAYGVMVLGNEGAGKYIEILDRKTGARLGYKQFAEPYGNFDRIATTPAEVADGIPEDADPHGGIILQIHLDRPYDTQAYRTGEHVRIAVNLIGVGKQGGKLHIPSDPTSRFFITVIDPDGHIYKQQQNSFPDCEDVSNPEKSGALHLVPREIRALIDYSLALTTDPAATKDWHPEIGSIHPGKKIPVVPPLTFTHPGLYHVYAMFRPKIEFESHSSGWAWPMRSEIVPFRVENGQ